MRRTMKIIALAVLATSLWQPANADGVRRPQRVAVATAGAIVGAVVADDYSYRTYYRRPYYQLFTGYGYADRSYLDIPYGTSAASPSYYDEICHVVSEPTPYGWRRVRICE